MTKLFNTANHYTIYCRGGPPWPPGAERDLYIPCPSIRRVAKGSNLTPGGHGGPPLQYVLWRTNSISRQGVASPFRGFELDFGQTTLTRVLTNFSVRP